MAFAFARFALACALLGAHALAAGGAGSGGLVMAGDRTITKVVKLLQDLLAKSKADADSDRTLYGKYVCYCDTTKAAKEAEIVDTSGLVAEVEELKASNALLSQEVEKLDKDMKANEASRADAKAIRDKENAAYILLKDDLTGAVVQLNDAIKVLTDIGADQTLQSAADHKQYMAGEESPALVKLKSSVKQALLAASAFVSKRQLSTVNSFLQAPFTGTYTTQSGEVLGILRDMRDTFNANLKAAEETEQQQLAAWQQYDAEMSAAHATMLADYNGKQGLMGQNDSILSTKEMQLKTLLDTIAAAQAFLEKLAQMCAEKKKEYDHRVQLRLAEQSALAEAISILNSDAAFETFGATTAASSGPTSLIQRASIKRHRASRSFASVATPQASKRQGLTKAFLRKAGGSNASPLLSRVLAMLQANNPFDVVLAELDKIIALMAKEEEADKVQKAWCDSERTTTNGQIDARKTDITILEGAITDLNNAIDDPLTGLKVTIKTDEDSLAENYQNQESETKDRREDNAAYQKNVKTLVEAQALLERAVVVLQKYYEKKIHEVEAGLMQVKRREDPAPPATWTDTTYKGQSEGATSAIDMLQFVLKNTKAEETQAHEDERSAQHSYEDSMAGFKSDEATLLGAIASNKQALAQKEEELLDKKTELDKTQKEKAALETYLESITPGCKFIDENIDQRNSNRAAEKATLEAAVGKIKGTPAYMAAKQQEHQESLGECVEICAPSEDHVNCKACLAKVTVPGYCAGHPSTVGCA